MADRADHRYLDAFGRSASLRVMIIKDLPMPSTAPPLCIQREAQDDTSGLEDEDDGLMRLQEWLGKGWKVSCRSSPLPNISLPDTLRWRRGSV